MSDGRNVSKDIPWIFILDQPKKIRHRKNVISISGWFTTTDEKKVDLRLQTPEDEVLSIKYGAPRPDVIKILKNDGYDITNNKVGFLCECTIQEGGTYHIEARIGDKDWAVIHSLDLQYDPELMYVDLYNPEYSDFYAKHQALLNSKQKYFFEPAAEGQFRLDAKDPKLVALYLPQFHTFKENDEWWGKGFTEWSGVTSTVPRFAGHEQPKLPADLGFYDLKNEEVMRDQIAMAKKHGIYAFCFYYYWFSGKRLLERPLDMFLAHKEWDFNFMICWANENWTRRWDGMNWDVLMGQKHAKDDPLKFIKDVAPILADSRYIRVGGKPILMVYRPKDLKVPKEYARIWRDYFKKHYGSDLHLVSVQGFDYDEPQTLGFDKGMSFVPHTLPKQLDVELLPKFPHWERPLDINFSGAVNDYREIALKAGISPWGASNYPTVMPSWDNDARKKGNASGVFHNSNPDIYAHWLRDVLDRAKPKDKTENLIFVNAWNEWAEGAYLEPDKQYGHAFLNRTSEVLAEYSNAPNNMKEFPLYSIRRTEGAKLAVVVHMYYASMWPMFRKKLSKLPKEKYDLFVTIPLKNEDIREEVLKFKENTHVITVANHGRDVLPFIHLGRRLADVGYEHVLKLHTKKSPHRKDGDNWMLDLLNKLVPDDKVTLARITETLNMDTTGLIGPAGHFISLVSFFGGNRETVADVLGSIVGDEREKKVIDNLGAYGFFAGTMFWARLDSLRPIFDKFYQSDDFEVEQGQVDGTFAHALERVFSVIPEVNKKSMYTLEKGGVLEKIPLVALSSKTEYQYALNAVQANRDYPGLERPSALQLKLKSVMRTRGGKAINIMFKAPSLYSAHGPVVANQIIRSVIDDRYHGPKLFPMTLPATKPGVKFIAENLDGSKISNVFVDIAGEFNPARRNFPVEFHTFIPARGDNITRLRKAGFRPKVHLDTNISLDFTAGDTMLLNLSQPAPIFMEGLIDALNDNNISQVLWFVPKNKAGQFEAFAKDQGADFLKFFNSGKITVFHVGTSGGIMRAADGTKVTPQKLVQTL